MPARSATSSLVTFSKPRTVNRSSAARSTRARVSPRGGTVLVPVTDTSCCSWHPVSLTSATSTRTPARRFPMPETHQDDVLEAPPAAQEELVEESLVEEVSIDGMCGVY